LDIKHMCKNCYKLVDLEKLFSKSQGFCTYRCWTEYDRRAQAVGGYHVLARDEAIRDLKIENQALREERDQLLALLPVRESAAA
jgi:hypothetical protein